MTAFSCLMLCLDAPPFARIRGVGLQHRDEIAQGVAGVLLPVAGGIGDSGEVALVDVAGVARSVSQKHVDGAEAFRRAGRKADADEVRLEFEKVKATSDYSACPRSIRSECLGRN